MSQPPGSGRHMAVVGLQWGDEGKGKIVDLLAVDYDYVVRFNGGANAGHTVVVGNQRYALHLVPCGVLHEGKTGVIGNGVVVDPDVLADEIDMLRRRGVAVNGNLRLSDRAHLVMPYHKTADVLLEAAIGAAMGSDRAIGTTARGIGPSYADKALRTTAVRVGDLLDLPHLGERLPYIAAVKNASLAGLAALGGREYEPLASGDLASLCARYAENLAPHVTDTAALLREADSAGRRILFEGANGFLLDVDHGTYPYVTSSNASALGIFAGAGVPGRTVEEITGVVKAYTSRVGGGPFPTELSNPVGERIRERGREYGTTTGRPRRCGWLDLVAVRYAAQTSGATRLALALLDVLAGLPEIAVCVAYNVRGERMTEFPASAADLAELSPVLVTLPGFGEDVSSARRFADLPAAAARYLETIESFVGLPVEIVSIGPERSQTLVRDD